MGLKENEKVDELARQETFILLIMPGLLSREQVHQREIRKEVEAKISRFEGIAG